MLRRPAAGIVAALSGTVASAAFGADVLFTLSSPETYVGAPVQLRITIKGATEHQPPEFPVVDGAEVQPPRRHEPDPGTAPHSGRRERLVTYTYTVIPRRAGTLTIPPIRVVADGESFLSAPMQIVVRKSEAGDLLYVRLVGQRESVYVGEPVDVTLEIWLKPYETKSIRMDARDLWLHAVDEQASAWGPFAEDIESGSRNVIYTVQTRQGARGGSQRYFVYALQRRVWPQRPGVFSADDVSVVVNYPLRVRTKRVTRIGCPHDVVESRPILATVVDSGIVVHALPAAGQPESFRGAVGKYTMIVAATPTEVSIGDPISLTLTVRGTGRMDLLQAPRLAEQDSLTADFRVPDEELAGVISGMVKTFTQTIRAKHDGATFVPPVQFSYFDPQVEQYVVLNSDPIPLQVRESNHLAVTRVPGGTIPAEGRTTLRMVESGLLANYDDVDALLQQQATSLGWGTWAFAASGPLLCLTCWLTRWHRDRTVSDTGFRRRRSAKKTAMAAIRLAACNSDDPSSAPTIAAAVSGYIADRCNLPPGGTTRGDAIGALRTRGAPEGLIDEVDALLSECETARYGASPAAVADNLIERALRCVNSLEEAEF